MKKSIRKLLIMITSLILVFTSCAFFNVSAADNSIKFFAKTTEISDGKFAMTVYTDFSCNQSACGINLWLYYDKHNFTTDTYTPGDDFISASLIFNSEVGSIRMIWDEKDPYSGGVTELYTVRFMVNEDAVEGNYQFNFVCSELYDSKLNNIASSSEDIYIRVGDILTLSQKKSVCRLAKRSVSSQI